MDNERFFVYSDSNQVTATHIENESKKLLNE